MNKLYPLFILLTILFSCRKDKSEFVSEEHEQQSGDNRKCNVLQYGIPSENSLVTQKYVLDSVLTEIVSTSDGDVDDAWYLEMENAKQFLFYDNDKTADNVQSRLYLNEDGAIQKEIRVHWDDEGGVFKEEPEDVKTFMYNDKKQLIKIEMRLEENGTTENGDIHFTYDEVNRINKVVFVEEGGKEVMIYDNFKYDYHAKNDNFLTLDLLDTPSSYFIPSLRNVYISAYREHMPELPDYTTIYKFEYSFSAGKLVGVSTIFDLDDEEIKVDLNVSLACK